MRRGEASDAWHRLRTEVADFVGEQARRADELSGELAARRGRPGKTASGLAGFSWRSDNLCVRVHDSGARSLIELRRGVEELAKPGAFSWESVRRYGSSLSRGRLTKFQPCLPEPLELDLAARSLLGVEGAR